MLEDWLAHASSIWSIGYEAWRETVEVKPVNVDLLGKCLGFGTLEPTKGSGRISMLLFTLWYSYLEMKNICETMPAREEFQKQPGSQQLSD